MFLAKYKFSEWNKCCGRKMKMQHMGFPKIQAYFKSDNWFVEVQESWNYKVNKLTDYWLTLFYVIV